MPRRCTICYNQSREAIDTALVNNVEYSQITSNFAVSQKALATHRKNHLQPIVDRANTKAEQQIVDKIVKYRTEVNYSPLVKAKFAQSKLLDELDNVYELNDKLNIIREFRGWFQEENKLAGNYKKEGENPDTISTVAKRIKELFAENPDFDEADRERAISIYVEKANLDAQQAQQVRDLVNQYQF